MVDFFRPVHCLLGLPFDAVTEDEALALLERARQQRSRCFLSTPNLNFLIASQADPAFRQSVCRSDLSVADGMPVVWFGRLLGLPLRERVSGSGLFERLRRSAGRPWRVFFFGGPPGVAERACERLAANREGVEAAGWLYPGFGSVSDMSRPDWIDTINRSEADFVLVSLGSAKGQAWITHNLAQLRAPVISHLGAVVNFVAGSVRRAPVWMQRSGLEWVWRIREEPKLWQRYGRDGAAALKLVATRVLPLFLLDRLQPPAPAEHARAEVRPLPGDGGVSLHGAWAHDNLLPVREAFTRLAARGGAIRLDMADVSGIDSAFAGLLLLLDATLRDRGGSLALTGAPPALVRRLRLHGAWPSGAE